MLTIEKYSTAKYPYSLRLKSSSVSFKAVTLPINNSRELTDISSFDINTLTDKYMTPENLKGSGANSTVYNMPDYPKYVLKVLNKPDPNHININDFLVTDNFGQPIWEENNVQILKKLDGWEHSSEDWSKIIYDPMLKKPKEVSAEQANEFFRKFSLVASFPESSFQELAKKVKYLDEKEYKIDSINPNNLLVDEKNKRLNVIDFFKIMPWDKPKNVFSNSYFDIVAMVADFTLFPEYYDKLNKEQKSALLKNVDIVNGKALRGAVNSGLSVNINKFKTFINYVVQFPACQVQNTNKYVREYDKRFADFVLMLTQPRRWALCRL